MAGCSARLGGMERVFKRAFSGELDFCGWVVVMAGCYARELDVVMFMMAESWMILFLPIMKGGVIVVTL